MKTPNTLQHWLSHLVEIPVVHTGSMHNAELTVVLHRGRYKLLTDGAIYSYGDLYSNFRKAFERFDWDKNPVSSCLILGLGLASIPYMLKTRFKKDIRFTAVEIDEVVTRLAYQLVLNPKGIPVDIFTADATDFLGWHRGKYDMICVDVFVGDTIPSSLQTIEALQKMNEMLKPGGVLLYNRLSRFKPDIDKSLKFQAEVFLHVFPDGGYMDVDGNWMFVNRMSAFRTSR